MNTRSSCRSTEFRSWPAPGMEVTTVEDIAPPEGTLSPVQSALREYDRLQCGSCTPGFVMSLTALLGDNPDPTDEIAEGLPGRDDAGVGHAAVNLCHRLCIDG
jgi:aerobic carbon-monoxide dehydrogenase small subunit